MATATTTRLVPIDETPEVRAARAALEPVAARHGQLQQQLRRFNAVLDPYVDRSHDANWRFDVLERLEAEAGIVTTRAQLALAEAELLRAERAVADARETAREKVRAVFDQKKRQPLEAHVADVLRARKSALALQQIQLAEHETVGTYLDPLWDVWLTDEAFENWCRRLRDYGFGDVLDRYLKD